MAVSNDACPVCSMLLSCSGLARTCYLQLRIHGPPVLYYILGL